MFELAFGQTAKPAQGSPSNPIVGLLPIILIFVVLYFLMILPQQRRQKKHLEMINALKKGDRIVTASGIYGIITNVKDNSFMVKIADNVEIELDKGSVSHKIGASA
jgi:preprotein translocase subunit YajC|uniref:Preprotein translocase subunit YajC n=1 Tax=candidate division WOR-3 bacterium TaxID=2052148 RepID=A0A7C6EBX5_UNCW3